MHARTEAIGGLVSAVYLLKFCVFLVDLSSCKVCSGDVAQLVERWLVIERLLVQRSNRALGRCVLGKDT